MRYYLAGPMSGYPQFNFPLFQQVAQDLRNRGHHIVSPAELDEENGIDKEAMSSKDGDASKLSSTWADLLSRDVKIISDHVQGIVFLPDWFKSRGAKLEAFVGLLQGKDFKYFQYINGELAPMSQVSVLAAIVNNMGVPAV
jgi:hypothetical protein